MADFIGRKIAYGAAKETARGTPETTATYWLPHLEASMQDKQTKALNESALGVIDKYNDSIVTETYAEGNIVGKVNIKSFGLILLATMGAESAPTDNTDGTYTHTFTRDNSNQSKALTLFRKEPNTDLKFALSIIKSLVIEIVTGEYVKYTAEFVSKVGVTATSTVAYTDETEFTSKYATIKEASLIAGLAAATAVSVKSIKLTIERESEPYYALGSVTPAEIHNKTFNVSIEVEKRYSDNTYKGYAFGNNKRAVLISLSNSDDLIGTASDKLPTITFQLPRTVVSEWEVDQGLDDIVMESFSLQGLFDLTTGYQMQATLLNTLATAY
jgi:hypothetical protein